MSSTNRRPRGQLSWYLNGGGSVLVRAGPQPGDEQQGGWSREQLLGMNDRFAAQLERAFASGRERRSSASACVRPGAGDRDRLLVPLYDIEPARHAVCAFVCVRQKTDRGSLAR